MYAKQNENKYIIQLYEKPKKNCMESAMMINSSIYKQNKNDKYICWKLLQIIL